MANPVQGFGQADQVMINLLAFLQAERVESANTPLALSILAEVAPRATKANPHVRAMLPAVHAVLAAAPNRYKPSGAADWARAWLDARAALDAFFWWRAAQAYDAMNPATITHPEVAS